jgi:hypothetical protein
MVAVAEPLITVQKLAALAQYALFGPATRVTIPQLVQRINNGTYY